MASSLAVEPCVRIRVALNKEASFVALLALEPHTTH